MSSNRRTCFLLCGVSVALVACDAPGRGPVEPRTLSATVTSELSESSIDDGDTGEATTVGIATILSATGGSASGHAYIHATPRQNVVDQAYSFIAESTGGFPTAKGQFEVHSLRFTGETVNVHAEITCMAVSGNQAWIGAKITRATVDEVEVPNSVGLSLTFRVQDNAEGPDATDLASLFFLPAGAGGDLTFCNTRPTTNALRVSTRGNIQVKPE